jgi:hypothetical protein
MVSADVILQRDMPSAHSKVMLSKMHNGGDMRVKGKRDKGAYDEMKSYQLKDTPGYVKSHHKRRSDL